MGEALFESSGNLKRAKLLLNDLASPRHATTMIKWNDNQKLIRIRDYVDKYGRITQKQYKALLHYCKVYKVKIPQSIDFILD